MFREQSPATEGCIIWGSSNLIVGYTEPVPYPFVCPSFAITVIDTCFTIPEIKERTKPDIHYALLLYGGYKYFPTCINMSFGMRCLLSVPKSCLICSSHLVSSHPNMHCRKMIFLVGRELLTLKG